MNPSDPFKRIHWRLGKALFTVFIYPRDVDGHYFDRNIYIRLTIGAMEYGLDLTVHKDTAIKPVSQTGASHPVDS